MGYKLWYSESVRYYNGVGILVDEELRMQVMEFMRVNDRMMKIKLVIGGFALHVCSVYAPQVGVGEEVKVSFWEELDEVVRTMPSSEKIVIARDFNGHIGALPGGYDNVYGGFGFGDRNGEGAALLDFARVFGLVIVNLSFLKKEDHLITFCSAIAKTQIDFLLLRKGDRGLYKDCKFISINALEIGEKVVEKEVWESRGDVDTMWDRAASGITETTKKGVGLYKLAKARKRKSQDLDQVKYIRGDGSVLMENVHIKKRWQEYFYRLLNEEGDRGIVLGELENSEESRDFRFYSHFKVEEVKKAIRTIQRGRAMEPNEISVDFWKYVSEVSLR
ncbi:uncharacterized protein LOC107844437 [Capsicum annuum]|uniref:uncharacterized protein LOC107844437 n=1 Tax=Capsicum annuum TaxID=4072 RepID=UPI001FB0F6C7|nr:uncharacterized protein LOC107844437 [Capsicum annuum]